LGLFAAFSSRVAEDLIMRAMDILMSFPYIILAVTLMAVLGRSELNIIMVIAITRIPQFARVSRAAALSLRSKEFVESAITIGQSKLYIVGRHILPNCLGSIVVLSTLSVATAIHTEAAISFLGLGITPPTPSWGLLMNESRPYLFNAPWVALWPGFMITIAVLGINFLGDGLRDTLDVTLIASEKK
jgi:peptide/nickel transport system permease protein